MRCSPSIFGNQFESGLLERVLRGFGCVRVAGVVFGRSRCGGVSLHCFHRVKYSLGLFSSHAAMFSFFLNMCVALIVLWSSDVVVPNILYCEAGNVLRWACVKEFARSLFIFVLMAHAKLSWMLDWAGVSCRIDLLLSLEMYRSAFSVLVVQ